MFDLRYHVASLAAVFFALIIGILVGVALASHGLGDTERDRLQEDLRRAQLRGEAAEARLESREESAASEHAFVEKSYRVVMANRLKGARIAVLFVGSINDDVQSEITRALSDAGAGTPLRIRALQVPINPTAVAQRLANRPFLAAYAADDQLEELGHALGQEFIAGKEIPLWNALESLIVEQKDGSANQSADGVIVVRTVPAQIGATAVFLKGLYSGIKDVGVPAVGIDLSDGDGSSIKAFKKAELSTVDNVDTRVGKLALVILLSEPAVTGNYGTKTTADTPLPNVVPVPTTTGG